MENKFIKIIYRTRGVYMMISLVISMVIKFFTGGSTTISLLLLGIFLAGITQVLRIYSASYLWGRQAVSKPGALFLATSGPYAYIRNPLYLGNLIIGLSFCLVINEWYAYCLFLLSYIFVYSQVIPYEERYLEEKFGDQFVEYKSHVGLLIPKFHAFKGGTAVTPNFVAGFMGEIHVPVFLAALFTTHYFLFVR